MEETDRLEANNRCGSSPGVYMCVVCVWWGGRGGRGGDLDRGINAQLAYKGKHHCEKLCKQARGGVGITVNSGGNDSNINSSGLKKSN